MDLLTEVMAAFENGHSPTEGNPFDEPEILRAPEALAAVIAFSAAAAEDTPSTEPEAFVMAGLLQGFWIGYEYARRETA